MRGMLCVVVVALMLVAVSNADFCVGKPSTLPAGASCGGAISCAYGLYCDKSGVCSTRAAAGQTCYNAGSNDICAETATCKGPTGSLTCVTNANPGEPCSTSSSDSVPFCGSNSCLNSVCGGGYHGDSCISKSDCVGNLTCTNNVCTALPDGSYCTLFGYPDPCMPGSACIQNICTKKIASGDCTLSSSLCGYGTACVYNPIANTTTCIAMSSLNAGDYCGSSSNGYLCKDSQRCVNTQCAPGRVSTCSAGACSFDEYCNCGGLYLQNGQGQCQKNPCLDQWGKYTKCAYDKCRSENMGRTNFAKSCMQVNCAKETSDYMMCAGASETVASLLFVSFFAIFASYFSKKF